MSSIRLMKLVTCSFQCSPLNWAFAFSVPSSSKISIRTFILLPRMQTHLSPQKSGFANHSSPQINGFLLFLYNCHMSGCVYNQHDELLFNLHIKDCKLLYISVVMSSCLYMF